MKPVVGMMVFYRRYNFTPMLPAMIIAIENADTMLCQIHIFDPNSLGGNYAVKPYAETSTPGHWSFTAS